MSVIRLNKLTGLQPQKETLEEFQGPSKSLEEINKVAVSNHCLPSQNFPLTQATHTNAPPCSPLQQKNIKSELSEVEHYIEKSEGPERGLKLQLQQQLFKTKQEMVRLERMLNEQLAAKQDIDMFEDDEEAEQKLK